MNPGCDEIAISRTHTSSELVSWYRKPFILRGQLPDPKSASVDDAGRELMLTLNEDRFANPEHVHLRFTRGERLLGFVSYRPLYQGVVDGHVALIAGRSTTMKCIQLSFDYMKKQGTEWVIAVVYPGHRAIRRMLDDLGFFPADGIFPDPVQGRLHLAKWLS